MKAVINTCYGGFRLSERACKKLKSLMSVVELVDNNINDLSDINNYFQYKARRTDERLVQVVEELGTDANTGFSFLEVVEIPDDYTDMKIVEYDGDETLYYVQEGKIKTA